MNKGKIFLSLLVFYLLFAFCGSVVEGPETLKIKAIGLPEGYVVKITASFYPAKLNPFCMNYWSIPAQGRAIPMSLEYIKELTSKDSAVAFPLTNSKIPIFKKWPFCKWRIDVLYIDIRYKSETCFTTRVYPKQDSIWQKELGHGGMVINESEMAFLPDTFIWSSDTLKCKNSILDQTYFLFHGNTPSLIIRRCD
jgi:hypothetical protein